MGPELNAGARRRSPYPFMRSRGDRLRVEVWLDAGAEVEVTMRGTTGHQLKPYA